jgi:putative membrane protein
MYKYALGLATLTLAFAVAARADDNPDASFYKKAAEGGLAEVELGQLAEQKSSSPAVKDFGAMMVTDHTAANQKLSAIATHKNIDLPTRPNMGQMATKTKLAVLSGATFDKSYIKGMVEDHEEDIKEFEQEAASGQDPDAKAYAAATLPTLRKHLATIKEIAAAQGVDAS